MTQSMLRAYDFAGGTVVHINWPFNIFALLVVALVVLVIVAKRKR